MPGNIFYFKDSKIPEETAGVPQTLWSVVRTGVLKEEIIRLTYCDSCQEKTGRDVLPEVIFRHNDDWYLAGYCYLRNAQRTFCFDRIEAADRTGDTMNRRALRKTSAPTDCRGDAFQPLRTKGAERPERICARGDPDCGCT